MKLLAVVVTCVPTLAFAQPVEPTPPPDAGTPSETPPPDPVPAPPPEYVVPVRAKPEELGGIDQDSIPPSVPFPDRNGSHRVNLDLELFTSADWTLRDGGSDLAQFRLDRGELGTTFNYDGHFGAELRLETLRSGAEGGALGIAGDSLVVRPKRAQVFGEYEGHEVDIRLALGVTPDPWITALEEDLPLRALSATGSERLLGWPPSDLAGLVRVIAGPVRLTVSIGNGEGLSYPERNNGKTTTAVAEVVPFHAMLQRLRFMVMGKNGSVGPALVRDHRLGGAATFYTDFMAAGGELVRAWGVGDRGDVAGWLLEGWADFHTGGPFRLSLRAATIGYDAGGRHSSYGGAFAITPFADADRSRDPYDHRERLRIWLAIDRTTASGNAVPLPGADPGNATTLMLIASTQLFYGAN